MITSIKYHSNIFKLIGFIELVEIVEFFNEYKLIPQTEIFMTFARINNVELNSESEADTFISNFTSGKLREIFPEAEILISIRTGPSSVTSVSVYKNKRTADSVAERRNSTIEGLKSLIKSLALTEGKVEILDLKKDSGVGTF